MINQKIASELIKIAKSICADLSVKETRLVQNRIRKSGMLKTFMNKFDLSGLDAFAGYPAKREGEIAFSPTPRDYDLSDQDKKKIVVSLSKALGKALDQEFTMYKFQFSQIDKSLNIIFKVESTEEDDKKFPKSMSFEIGTARTPLGREFSDLWDEDDMRGLRKWLKKFAKATKQSYPDLIPFIDKYGVGNFEWRASFGRSGDIHLTLVR